MGDKEVLLLPELRQIQHNEIIADNIGAWLVGLSLRIGSDADPNSPKSL